MLEESESPEFDFSVEPTLRARRPQWKTTEAIHRKAFVSLTKQIKKLERVVRRCVQTRRRRVFGSPYFIGEKCRAPFSHFVYRRTPRTFVYRRLYKRFRRYGKRFRRRVRRILPAPLRSKLIRQPRVQPALALVGIRQHAPQLRSCARRVQRCNVKPHTLRPNFAALTRELQNSFVLPKLPTFAPALARRVAQKRCLARKHVTRLRRATAKLLRRRG